MSVLAEAVDASVAGGVTLFDTAEIYLLRDIGQTHDSKTPAQVALIGAATRRWL